MRYPPAPGDIAFCMSKDNLLHVKRLSFEKTGGISAFSGCFSLVSEGSCPAAGEGHSLFPSGAFVFLFRLIFSRSFRPLKSFFIMIPMPWVLRLDFVK